MDRLPHLLTQRASLLNLLIIWTALFSHAFASCFTGDGNLDTSSTPCPGSNMCCYLNRSDGYADDVCIQGACYSNYWTGEYFVIGCTSQNWDEEGSGCSPLWDACGTHRKQICTTKQLTVAYQGDRQDTPTFRAAQIVVSAAARKTRHAVVTIRGYI
jgi:hypothetical protein